MLLENIRFMVFVFCLGTVIFFGLLLFIGRKYNISPPYGLFIVWLGSLTLGGIIGIDFIQQGIKLFLGLILPISPLWIIALSLVSLNILLIYR